jgi:hypothetical protein
VYSSLEEFKEWAKLWSFGRPVDLESGQYIDFTDDKEDKEGRRLNKEVFIIDYNKLSREDLAIVKKWFNSLSKTHKQITKVF